MESQSKNPNAEAPYPAPLSLDLAVIRFSVVCENRAENGFEAPYLQAFLAGWFSRAVGIGLPPRIECGSNPDSFCAGWSQANEQAGIWQQQHKNKHHE